MLVVCDTYDHEDYPVYVKRGEDARARAKPYVAGENMTRLMEVYNLDLPAEPQLGVHRAFNY